MSALFLRNEFFDIAEKPPTYDLQSFIIQGSPTSLKECGFCLAQIKAF
jgi:hypothetical protein